MTEYSSTASETIRAAADIIATDHAGYVVDHTDIRAALRSVSVPSAPPILAQADDGPHWWADNCLDIVLGNEPDLREMETAAAAAETLRALADRLYREEQERAL